jgi:amino acid transporter
MLFAMSEQRDLPRVFEKTHAKFKTPYVAILATAAVILILTIQSSFLTAVAIATITRLLVYVTTCVALPLFRRRGDVSPAQFSAPLGIGCAIISVALIFWLLTNVDFAKEGLAILIAAVVGFLIYFVYRQTTSEISEK